MKAIDKFYNVVSTLIVALPLIGVGIVVYRSGLLTGAIADQRGQLVSAQPVTSHDSQDIEPFSEAYVSITFDDGWESSYEQGAQVLGRFNMPATFYMLSDYFDDQGYMTIEQAKHLQELGHQLGAHTATHADLTSIEGLELDYELAGSKLQFSEDFGAIEHFASPYNKYNDKTLSLIEEFYSSHRNTNGGLNTDKNFDPYQITAYAITDTTSMAEFHKWLVQAEQQDAWLVLNYHQVDESDGQYAVTPTDFESHIRAIEQSDITVVRLDTFLEAVGNQE